MRRVQCWIAIVGLWLLLALPALAQGGSVRVEDPDGILGAQANTVRSAAQKLANEGAEVIVVAAGTSAGTSAASADQYLDQYLSQNNIAPSQTQLRPNQIVFYVARDARRTALRFGQRWINKLRPVGPDIQAQQMNPRFQSGDIAGGLVAGINAARTTINPPNTLAYIIGGVLVIGVIGIVAVPLLRRRQQAATALASARERMTQTRRDAGAAIADLGRIVEAAQEKAQYDKLSYSAENVQRLQQMQDNGMQLFQQAQAAFDAAEEQQATKGTLIDADYTAIAAKYAQAQDLARRANAAISEAEALRAQLDAQGTPSTGPTTRL